MRPLIEKLKQNPFLFAGIIALLFCGGIAWLRADELTQLTARESELMDQLETIRQNVKHSKNIEQDTQDLEAYVASIKERLFVGEERSINIDFFYSLEERLNILISEVNQLDVENPRFAEKSADELKLYSVIMYTITLNGTFQEVLRVLYEIYQIEPIMRVTDFQIDTVGGSDSESGKLVAKLRVAVLAAKK